MNINIIDKLILNLASIARIPKGKKISTDKNFIVIEDESVLQGVRRSLRGESRDKMITKISETVLMTIEYAMLIIESKYLSCSYSTGESSTDIEIAKSAEWNNARRARLDKLITINNGLVDAQRGIVNLCDTYASDFSVIASIQMLLGAITDKTTEITKLLATFDLLDA